MGVQKCLGYNVDKLYRNLVNSNDNDITYQLHIQ